MKNKVLTLVMLGAIGMLHAQKIENKVVEIEHQKVVKKQLKKGNAEKVGLYQSSKDGSIFQLYRFTPKKSTEEKLEVVHFDQNGNVKEVLIKDYTQETIRELGVNQDSTFLTTEQQNLKDYKAAYLKNSTFTGSPKLVLGTFKDNYHSSGVWSGYKFQKSSSTKFEENFWSFVAYPINETAIDRNNYLLLPPTEAGKTLNFAKYRRYISGNDLAYIGGVLPVAGVDQFLSGVYDVPNQTWVNKTTIDVGMKMLLGENPFLKEGKEGSILLASGDQYKLLQVDELGNKKHLIPLSINKSGGKVNKQPVATIYKNSGGELCVIAPTYETFGGKKVALSVSYVSAGKELRCVNLTNEHLSEKQQVPTKEKAKIKKFKYAEIEKIKELKNGDLLIVCSARREYANEVGRSHFIVHLDKKGNLLACYVTEGLLNPKDFTLSDQLPPLLIETKTGFYWMERSNVDGFEKGVHSDSYSPNDWYTIYSTQRLDFTIAVAQIIHVNLQTKTLSNRIVFKEWLVGDNFLMDKNNGLYLPATGGLQYLKL
ncbi:hypothetical protein KFE98_07655 [bacterium SCSIO 12741]|nr:hypothetical protein KFE98_07655 [bacterium SCSIO 12741]